ncbi:MAG: repressor LexA [Chloroflexi bacterium]|nr:repressor LexA [Chloroflexota bacterium]
MSKPLSARQQKILNFIRSFIRKRGYPPSIRDIVQGCQVSSTSVVDYNLNILERLGFIRRDREVSRGIELLGEDPRAGAVAVPIIGTIAAGQPIPTPDHDSWNPDIYESIDVPASLLGSRELVYALRVQGQSMVDALIDDGDVVIMEPAQTADNGDLVAAWLVNEREATLKKFYREGKRIRLQPCNAQMQPLYADARNDRVQGKVLRVVR